MKKPGDKRSTGHREGWEAHMEGPCFIALIRELVFHPEGWGPLRANPGSGPIKFAF